LENCHSSGVRTARFGSGWGGGNEGSCGRDRADPGVALSYRVWDRCPGQGPLRPRPSPRAEPARQPRPGAPSRTARSPARLRYPSSNMAAGGPRRAALQPTPLCGCGAGPSERPEVGRSPWQRGCVCRRGGRPEAAGEGRRARGLVGGLWRWVTGLGPGRGAVEMGYRAGAWLRGRAYAVRPGLGLVVGLRALLEAGQCCGAGTVL